MSESAFIEIVKILFGAVVGGFGAYAAIKEKLSELLTRMAHAESRANEAMENANKAHTRVDSHIEKMHAR